MNQEINIGDLVFYQQSDRTIHIFSVENISHRKNKFGQMIIDTLWDHTGRYYSSDSDNKEFFKITEKEEEIFKYLKNQII